MTITKKIQIINVKFGKNVEIIDPVNLYQCTIGDESFIGPFVEIQKDAIIGKKCRIQSHSFICSKVVIGNNCFIGHGVMFINDKFENGGPGGKENFEKTNIGQWVRARSRRRRHDLERVHPGARCGAARRTERFGPIEDQRVGILHADIADPPGDCHLPGGGLEPRPRDVACVDGVAQCHF